MCRMIVCEEYGPQEDGCGFFQERKLHRSWQVKEKGPRVKPVSLAFGVKFICFGIGTLPLVMSKMNRW